MNDRLEKLKARAQRAVAVADEIETLRGATGPTSRLPHVLAQRVFDAGKEATLAALDAELTALIAVEVGSPMEPTP